MIEILFHTHTHMWFDDGRVWTTGEVHSTNRSGEASSYCGSDLVGDIRFNVSFGILCNISSTRISGGTCNWWWHARCHLTITWRKNQEYNSLYILPKYSSLHSTIVDYEMLISFVCNIMYRSVCIHKHHRGPMVTSIASGILTISPWPLWWRPHCDDGWVVTTGEVHSTNGSGEASSYCGSDLVGDIRFNVSLRKHRGRWNFVWIISLDWDLTKWYQ